MNGRECLRCGRWFRWLLDFHEHQVRVHGARP
jgi:hypothetical protein